MGAVKGDTKRATEQLPLELGSPGQRRARLTTQILVVLLASLPITAVLSLLGGSESPSSH